MSAGIPPAGRGHHYQPYQQQQQQQQHQQQQQQQQMSSQQFVEQQQRQLQQRAPRRDDVGGLQVGPKSFNQQVQHHIAAHVLSQQPRSTLADINRHLPGHVHVDYSLTDGQQLVRDVAGRRRAMELMMRSSDQV